MLHTPPLTAARMLLATRCCRQLLCHHVCTTGSSIDKGCRGHSTEVVAALWCRAGEAASTGLTESLLQLGFETDRLKTGTPARVDGRTIDYSKLEAQPGAAQVVLVQRCALAEHRTAC